MIHSCVFFLLPCRACYTCKLNVLENIKNTDRGLSPCRWTYSTSTHIYLNYLFIFREFNFPPSLLKSSLVSFWCGGWYLNLWYNVSGLCLLPLLLCSDGSPCVFVSPHLLCRVDVHSLVELILKHRHHGVIPRDPVDSGVFQTHLFYQTTADLHDQGDELRGQWGHNLTLGKQQQQQKLTVNLTTVIHLVISARLTFVQPHAKSFGSSLLRLLHDVDAPRWLGWAAFICKEKKIGSYQKHWLPRRWRTNNKPIIFIQRCRAACTDVHGG